MFSRLALLLCPAFLLLLSCLAAPTVYAGAAPFDLAGPALDVKVTRGTKTLPAAQVPNLLPGDLIWIKADLPASQSAHYLLVSAFLSGSTNPPPENWFVACKLWKGKCGHDGMTVTVPKDAQQVLLFLAPETGGDFKTLVGAVRGRPGAFVRTSQDLNQAALDRSRLEAYLSSVRAQNEADPAKLAQVTPLLARSLAIKVDEKCLDRMPALQAPCLMAGGESIILNDGHSTSIVEALTSGPGADLAMEASYTPQLSYGYYSPYVASVLDIARILELFHTAQYQYIPALATARGDQLILTLNTAPSFHDPKSVLVAALPAVEQPQPPPMHAVDPKEIYCARKTTLVLPVDGAPLVFSTAYAHDLTLSLLGKDGKTLELPAVPDAARGGLVVDTSGLGPAALGDSVQASIRGYWGFDPYRGPSFRLVNSRATSWELAGGDAAALIVGRQDTIHVRADSVSCVDNIMLEDPAGKELKVDWKPLKSDEVEVKLPLQEAQPGAMKLWVTQYGVTEPQAIPVRTFSEVGHFEGFVIHAGDVEGTLKGSRLDEVQSLTIKNVLFTAGDLVSHQGNDELAMRAVDPEAAAALQPEHPVAGKITLKDGRVLTLTAAVEAPRPRVALLGKTVQIGPSGGQSNILLSDPSELPQGGTLVFSLRTQAPPAFTHDESIEVATADEASTAVLSVANGDLSLATADVAVATLNPSKAFGAAAFGPLKYRVTAKGVAGDWQPLATLVRLPMLQGLECPSTADVACKLTGDELYLIDSVSGDPDFKNKVLVPEGFLGSGLPVPHPTAGALYIKLRDDPLISNPSTLTAHTLPAVPAEADRSEARQSALQREATPSDAKTAAAP